MAFDLDSFVLRAPRTAPANALTTGTAINGVVRDIRDLPGSFDLPGTRVEASADQYRTSTLDNPDQAASTEYLLWAANDANLATLETTEWTIEAEDPEAASSIPSGNLTVTNLIGPDPDDGTARLIVQDPGERGIASVQKITILRGDGGGVIECGPEIGGLSDFAVGTDPDGGIVVLSATTLGLLGGGVSNSRGDTITEVRYIIAASRFWWTRNDKVVTRFGWRGRQQRWEAFKGSPPQNAGVIIEDETTALSPKPTRFSVGDFLPGDPLFPDTFAMIRVGAIPDASGTPVIVEVIDDDLIGTYGFPGISPPDAVIGVTNGTLQWNPDYVDLNAGRTVWYSFESFQENANGLLGPMLDANTTFLFLTPIPGATDRPFIRFGFRRPLIPIQVDDDAELLSETIPAGSVGWSLSTGKLKFNQDDLDRADADTAFFDIQFLGNGVYYDGVSLTTTSLRTRDPVQLVDDTGTPAIVENNQDLFIPDHVPMPAHGRSGILHVADGTGTIPKSSPTPQTRPNGSGLVRQVAGVGDLIVFGPSQAMEVVEIVEFNDELPTFQFAMKRGKCAIAKELIPGDPGSQIKFRRGKFTGDKVYFLQADVQPAVHMDEARIFSREIGPFTFDGTERLIFNISGTDVVWLASALTGPFPVTVDAVTVAASIDAARVLAGASGSVFSLRDHIIIRAGSLSTGTVEIGFGATTPGNVPSGALDDRDFSAASILGFLPGWRLDPAAGVKLLPDSGASVGLFRSPLNLNRENDISDFKSRARFNNVSLADSVIASQYFTLDYPPLQDVVGFDENVFFTLVFGLNFRRLENFDEVLYDFGNDRFGWLDSDTTSGLIEGATEALFLGHNNIIGLTMNSDVELGNGLYLAETGGPLDELVLGEDFILESGGATGNAIFVEVLGGFIGNGSGGTFSAGGTVFADANADFLNPDHPVLEGYRLTILNGDARGSYIVAADATSATSVTILAEVPFPVVAPSPFASWEMYTGVTDEFYDPSLVADVLYKQFNHLASEPFQVRALSSTGTVPTDATAQAAGRNVAVMSDALKSGRIISIRFGLESGSPEATMTGLVTTEIGVMANDSLGVPDLADPHFLNDNFSILVGSRLYTQDYPTTGDGPLVGVAVFADPIVPADKIEYISDSGAGDFGELKFGSDTLLTMLNGLVQYVQEFLDTSVLPSGEVEYQEGTGDLNFSDADMALYGGNAIAYFVEQMITEENLDVVISPLGGIAFFNRPLREFQIVEVTYFQADTGGNKLTDDDGNDLPPVTEFLPLFVRREEATYISESLFSFNPSGRTIAESVEPFIWLDDRLLTYGNVFQASMNAADSTISLSVAATPSSVVTINYAVYEAFGGEQSYTVSLPPVYRPPFFLETEQTVFDLETDRTGDLFPGVLFRLGATVYYVKGSSYDVPSDSTTVEVFPASDLEQGSRAPGNDVLTLFTNLAVTPDVDGVGTTAPLGFLLDFPLGTNYEPVDKGMLSLVLFGQTPYAVAGHLFEIGGIPFIIAGSQVSEDGQTTRIDVTSPFPRGFNALSDALKISARPIYPAGATQFLGKNPVAMSEDFQVVLFGETDESGALLPGRTLVNNVDYTLDPNTGDISFINPPQAGIQPNQRLLFSHTKRKVLSPFIARGILNFPRYRAQYDYITIPDVETNAFLGGTLLARYTFKNPDSYYYRTVPLRNYMGEVAQLISSRLAAQSPVGGPIVTSFPAVLNYKQGNLGLEAQRRDLEDQDRAARTFVSLYNEIIVPFEQVLEAIDGQIIGERSQKFRHFVGRSLEYAPPGYEDVITGYLVDRNVYFDVFASSAGFRPTIEDSIVDPETAELEPVTYKLDGDAMSPDQFALYRDEQRPLIRNDIDDIVITGRKRPFLAIGKFRGKGSYQKMGAAHRLSRLFPEFALAFTTTFPGIVTEDIPFPGIYSFRKVIEKAKIFKGEGPVTASTRGEAIGVIGNPSLPIIENITDAEPRDRLPRARVFLYSETGFPEFDSAIAVVNPDADSFESTPRPAIIATVLPLADFPLDPDTGLPDLTRLASNVLLGAGLFDLPDLGTGDPELSTPPFQGYDRNVSFLPAVAMGEPEGTVYTIGTKKKTLTSMFAAAALPIEFAPIYKDVFVHEVLVGCVLTFTEGVKFTFGAAFDDPQAITNGSEILRIGVGELEGEPFTASLGDTVWITTPSAEDIADYGNPIEFESGDEMRKNNPSYRPGFDIGVQKTGGAFTDKSFPSLADPSFPLQEFLGQRPPKPLTTIEADVEFVNVSRDPHAFPALLGEAKNDNGDYSIPYMSSNVTELVRLGKVADSFTVIGQQDAPGNSQAVYPDEIVLGDNYILAATDGTFPPATIITTAGTWAPVAGTTGTGTYSANTGIGDLKQYDIVLVQTGQAGSIPTGIEGIQSVGAVTKLTTPGATDLLELPRFRTRTLRGDPIQYTLTSAMTHVSTSFVSGVFIDEGVTTVGATTFDTGTTGAPVFNDSGIPGDLTGGLNNIIVPGVTTLIKIRIYENGGGGSPGSLLETIVLSGDLTLVGAITGSAFGGLGGVALLGPAAITFDEQIITVPALGFVDPTPLGGVFPGPLGPFDFIIDVDTYVTTINAAIMGIVSGTGTGSTTGRVGPDRLTFSDRYDMTTTLPRGTLLPDGGAGVLIETKLEVQGITAGPTFPVDANSAILHLNGGEPFSFLRRDALSPAIGTFVAGASGALAELGTIKVMSLEGVSGGFGNMPLPSTADFIVDGVPSSDEGPLGEICKGTGLSEDGTNRVTVENADVTGIGDVNRIEPGDILVIDASGVPNAAVKSGTYLIRHSIKEDNAATPGTTEAFLSMNAGVTGQYLNFFFPKVVLSDVVGGTVEITDASGPGPSGSAFAATGRLYFIPNSTDPTTVVSVEYTGYAGGETFSTTGGSGLDAAGAFVSDADIDTVANGSGVKVSGMAYLEVGSTFPNPYPSNNVVGYDSGTTTIGGFLEITISNSALTGDVTAGPYFETFSYPASLVDEGAIGAGLLGVSIAPVTASTSVTASRRTVVYDDVAEYIDVSEISTAQWEAVHGDSPAIWPTAVDFVTCIFPNDKFVTTDLVDAAGEADTGGGAIAGFSAPSGIYVEPSWPQTALNLDDGIAKVIDAAHSPSSLTVADIGIPDAALYSGATDETVTFEVRRIRRFHDVQLSIQANYEPLKFAFEIRRGTVAAGYGPAPFPFSGFLFAASGTGTQLGGFQNVDVNVNAGDVVRLVDSVGNVLDTAIIQQILSDTSLLLAEPGFAVAPPTGGESFEIYLNRAPVPHEQSAAQLEEVITSTLIRQATGVPNTAGGFVTTTNILEDFGGAVFGDVQAGDILIIDPAGPLAGPGGPATPLETGAPPFGDESVPGRTEHSPLGPSRLDDNRGFYRVISRTSTTVTVDPTHSFAGLFGTDVIFGATSPVDQRYAVLPVVSVGPENQNDLRSTSVAGAGDSYLLSPDSIAPFSYRIIRPDSLLGEETVDLILFNRERVLSMIEKIQVAASGIKGGDYFVFQTDNHIAILGDPDGLGLVSNEYISTQAGLTSVSPYANSSQALGVLDRRYWVLDLRLDRTVPPNSGSSTAYSSFEISAADQTAEGFTVMSQGSGRPVLPDLIADSLDNTDRLRELRFAWIGFRTERVNGTLPAIARFDEELPRVRQEQEDYLRLTAGLEDT